jgi:hypothetical protein
MTTSQKRLRFDHVEELGEVDGTRHLRLSFSFGERVIEETAPYAGEGVEALKAAAEATLKAVEQAVDNRFKCALADIDHVNALGKNLIAVLVDVQFEGREVQVFGSCQIAGTPLDSAVKSALNATNRFVELATRD